MDNNNKNKKAALIADGAPAANPNSGDQETPPWDNPALPVPVLVAAGNARLAQLLAPATYRYYTKYPKPSGPRALVSVLELLAVQAREPLPVGLRDRLEAWVVAAPLFSMPAVNAGGAAAAEDRIRAFGRQLEVDVRTYVASAGKAQAKCVANLWPVANHAFRRTKMALAGLAGIAILYGYYLWAMPEDVGAVQGIAAGVLFLVPLLMVGLVLNASFRRDKRDPRGVLIELIWPRTSVEPQPPAPDARLSFQGAAARSDEQPDFGLNPAGSPVTADASFDTTFDRDSNTSAHVESRINPATGLLMTSGDSYGFDIGGSPYGFDTSFSPGNDTSAYMDSGANPATGLPILDDNGAGMDIGGNPYGFDACSFDSSSSSFDHSSSFSSPDF